MTGMDWRGRLSGPACCGWIPDRYLLVMIALGMQNGRSMVNKAVRTALFPVAGRGTRFLPVTKASPTEMLPVVD